MRKIGLDRWKRNKKIKLIKKAFGGKNGTNKTNKQKGSSNVKRKTR